MRYLLLILICASGACVNPVDPSVEASEQALTRTMTWPELGGSQPSADGLRCASTVYASGVAARNCEFQPAGGSQYRAACAHDMGWLGLWLIEASGRVPAGTQTWRSDYFRVMNGGPSLGQMQYRRTQLPHPFGDEVLHWTFAYYWANGEVGFCDLIEQEDGRWVAKYQGGSPW